MRTGEPVLYDDEDDWSAVPGAFVALQLQRRRRLPTSTAQLPDPCQDLSLRCPW